MIVPYNTYKFGNTNETAMMGTHTLNPDGVRWERHRVWIVEADLKPGQRHVYSRWVFYIDEDSWQILATDSYDHSGAIYRIGFAYPYQSYGESSIGIARDFGVYDLSKGNYMIGVVHTQGNGFLHCSATMPDMSLYTPQSIAAQSIR
jgi:hypothetical protein